MDVNPLCWLQMFITTHRAPGHMESMSTKMPLHLLPIVITAYLPLRVTKNCLSAGKYERRFLGSPLSLQGSIGARLRAV
jgi:hypothetical protein